MGPTQESIEKAVDSAKKQVCELIEILVRQAVKDLEDAGKNEFKATFAVKGLVDNVRKCITIYSDGQSVVELKLKEAAEEDVIDFGTNLFEYAAANGGGRRKK